MTVQDLKTFYEYHYWANKKILPVIAQLKPEEFTKIVAGGYGSVRNTLVHLVSTEWGWLDRCGGHKRGPSLSADDYPTIEPLLKDWGKVEGYMHDFLSQLEDEDLDKNVEYLGKEEKNVQCPLENCFTRQLFTGHITEAK